MFEPNSRKTLTLAMVVVFTAACETGTEPEDRIAFDAQAALENHQALDLILESDAMEAFRALGAGITFQGVAPESELGPGPLNDPIISIFRRGKTFVYDPDLGRYVIDQDREGAPATGVRFILYQPGVGGKPDPLDFGIEVRGTESAQENRVDIDFEMGIASRDFLITGSVSGVENESGAGGEIDLLVRHGSDSFQVEVSGTDDSIDGTIFLNGEPFATVTGDPDDPTFTSATGPSLTWAEMLVLRQIIDSTEDVFDFWEDLLDPVDELVILAIIL